MGKATKPVVVAILILMLLASWGLVSAAPQVRLTLAVHRPSAFFAIGNGLAPLVSRNIPGVEATAQATGDAVDAAADRDETRRSGYHRNGGLECLPGRRNIQG